jgi:CBS domain-containing protein
MKGGFMGKRVRDAMTPAPQTIQADQPAAEAAKLMKEADAGMIPVMNNGDILGTVTDRDIVVRLIAEGRDPKSTAVGEIASTDVVTIEPDRDLEEALELMARHQVRRLPVVEGDRLVGVLAQADVAREGDEKEVGHTVEEISK